MNATPNFLAPLVLALYPLFVLALFIKYRPAIAVLLTLLIAELLLPPLYQLPISPSWLDKWSIPPLAAGVVSLIRAPRRLMRARPFRGVEAIFVVGVLVYIMAYLTNRDPLHYGPVTLQAQSTKDLSGDTMRFFIDPWLAFFLGRAFFKTSRDLRDLSRILTVTFLAYTLLILFEVRMSPNLNFWVYGYSAGSFATVVRWGGYRPVVFFKDGLPLAGYVLLCVLTTTAMARARMRVSGVSMKAVLLYAIFILLICKSTGAIGYGLVTIPLLYFLPPRTAYRTAWVIALCFLLYPVLRFLNVLDLKQIAGVFTGLSPERAESLLYRINMEDSLMEHAKKRLLWGWGDWGRGLVYDPDTGAQTSVPDGGVIIMITSHGIVGFYSYFIPFVHTVMRAGKRIKRIQSKVDRTLLCALALNCSIILFDLIINSFFTPLLMLLLGALYSLPAAIVAEERARQPAPFAAEPGALQIPVTAEGA